MLELKQLEQFYKLSAQISKRNILREYLQYLILEIIFDTSCANKFSFIGGTAIKIIYGSDRFSEDLDFDNFGLSEKEFKNCIDKIKKQLINKGLRIETKISCKGAMRCYLKFLQILYDYGITKNKKEKLVIQLDTTRQNFKFKPDLKIINKFAVFSQVRVNPLPIIFSQKIDAVLERKRLLGRDLYDLVYLSSLSSPNKKYLRKKVGSGDGDKIKTLIKKRIAKHDLSTLAKDIRPFVSSKEKLKVVENFDSWLRDWEIF